MKVKLEIRAMVKVNVKVENQSHYPRIIFYEYGQIKIKVKINTEVKVKVKSKSLTFFHPYYQFTFASWPYIFSSVSI